ncbi:MAG TPA: GyrI-like domain-containing protein [Pyrinomonadaceae bacterium]|nr:GyrI-like domain-containing protein [Acidobacteriota bacterium]HQZ97614.1 GyrI-like domain-containing protein [Pyrinomonadaceae bacterium]
MEPKIVEINELCLVGMNIRTSHAENRTFELWSAFKPRVKEIANRVSQDFYSVQIFDKGSNFENFTPMTKFEKWAAVEVSDQEKPPDQMSILIVPAGLYAVFIHHGLPSQFAATAAFIHGKWIPESEFEVGQRPHFDLMGPDYRHDDPNAQEEIWVPIERKK